MLVEVISKLDKELDKNAGAKVFYDYLKNKCKTDDELSKGILDKSKTLNGCMDDIKAKAKKKALNGCAMVEASEVFKWVEQYYGNKDIKITDEDVEAAEKSAKTGAPTTFIQKKPLKNENKKPQKKDKELEGQLDLFAMMGGN